MLIEEGGARVDSLDSHLSTPLHLAAYRGRADCVQYLLDHGADVEAVDENGTCALSWAAIKGHYDVIRLLVHQHNCHPNRTNLAGTTPLQRILLVLSLGIGSRMELMSLRLILAAMGQVNIDQTDMTIADEEAQHLLLSVCNQPRPLQMQCRYSIRRILGPCDILHQIDLLPLPSTTKNFLRIDNFLPDT